ncbi:MAG: isoaspartyl peptidase/L-asparaginase, partial [Planctomycetota bacterium]
MTDLSRRDFLQSAAAAAALAGALNQSLAEEPKPTALKVSGPVVVSSANGLRATEKAAEMIATGADTLDAVIAGVTILEEDPADNTVGYGGLPNEEGVVELDSSVMHGPSCRTGAVAALRNIKTPSQVAKVVMERTDHLLLVGDGALRFARAHGFKEYDLLTDESRKLWLDWKERHSEEDDWIPPEVPDPNKRSDARRDFAFTYGTITCLGLNP